MTLVAGVDSSTQATKVVVCEAETGHVVREGRARHPDGTECDPRAWWQAFTEATSGGLLDGVAALGVGGQQHGMVLLDDDGEVVRPALLWNDTRSAAAADDLVRELGGGQAWADAVGVVPVASITVAKLRWVAEHEPNAAGRASTVVLPHDWLTMRLRDRARQGTADVRPEPVTDRGDASGTGYWSAARGAYRDDLLARAFGRTLDVPRVAGPAEPAGETADGVLVSAGTGDNMGAGLALDLQPGDVVVSLGTSGTAFAVHDAPAADPSGAVAGFADAAGRYLPLVCTLNAARVLSAAAQMLDTDLAGLDRLALAASPGAGGLVLLPYLDGERTPNLPDAAGTLLNLRRDTMTPQNVARAAVEGMLCGLADGVDALRGQGVDVRRVLLVGGGSNSAAVRHVAPSVLAAPVCVPEPGEYVALGAARQAAWARAGTPSPPDWPVRMSATLEGGDARAGTTVRDRYAEARTRVHGS